jgi:hypothetical protein
MRTLSPVCAGALAVLAGCTAWLSTPGGADAAAADDAPRVDAPIGSTVDGPPQIVIDARPSIDGAPGPDAAVAACPASSLGARLGRDRLLLGGTMDDAAFDARPFDLRYVYLAANVPDPGPCGSCTSCTVAGKSCANAAGGCAWWGCWQYDQVPPGQYVVDFIQAAEDRGAIPMFSYYVWYTIAGNVEKGPELAALDDGARMKRYLADWRFLCQTVKRATDGPVILQVEPDLWGFGQNVGGNDPTQVAAKVSAAGIAACAGLPDDMTGFARCMVAIARAEAPGALVALHVSSWGAQFDAFVDNGPGFDLLGHADRTAAWFQALGVTMDLFTLDMSDRDAGFNDHWFDVTNQTRPNFADATAWAKRVTEKLGLPVLWWQVPYGHLGNVVACNASGEGAYEDNRVDYFFDHPERFAAGGALGIAFGAGTSCQTTPATDGGHFVSRAGDYYAGNRPVLCGP